MKRVVASIAMLLLLAGAVFAGEVGVSLEAKANLWTSDGFVMSGGDDYLGQLLLSYEAEKGGGFLRLRMGEAATTIGKYDLTPSLDRWQMWVKPIDMLKISFQTAPYEVFAESINWEPIFGAGLFESGNPKMIVELFPIKALTIMAGVEQTKKASVNGVMISVPDKDIFKTLNAAVKYNITEMGAVAVEFAMLTPGLVGGDVPGAATVENGDYKKIGVQFDYTGIKNLDLLVGYTAIIAGGTAFDDFNKAAELAGTEQKAALAQNRIELYATYSTGPFSVAFYDAMLIRDAGWGDFGNRLAVKASYALNDTISFWTRINHFMNYAPSWGYGSNGTIAWADCQLTGPGKDASKLRFELFANMNLGNGIGTYLGTKIEYDMSSGANAPSGDRLSYSIPLGITVNY